jgi:DNA-binding PadR family transcriptional regulator
MLGTLELQILLAVLRLRGSAYGVSIADEIQKRTGARPSLGAIYTTLDRLKIKKYVTSKTGDPTPERGGRRKLFFELTGLGEVTVAKSIQDVMRLREGLALPVPEAAR